MAESPAFGGFQAAAFEWFAGLRENNSKAWFHAHREIYDGAYSPAAATTRWPRPAHPLP